MKRKITYFFYNLFIFLFFLFYIGVDVKAALPELEILTHEGSEVIYETKTEYGIDINFIFSQSYNGIIDSSQLIWDQGYAVYEPNKAYTLHYPYGDAISIAGSMSNLYNCHAYALHFKGLQPINVSVWINNPNIYFTDGSLVEININTVKNGDIIAYYNSNLNIVHTGVIVDDTTKTLEGLKIRSKDGNGLLLEHGPYGCNYYIGDDSKIKFYRWNHINGSACTYDNDEHYYACQTCLYKTYESHNIICTKLDNVFTHLKSCTICSYSINEAHKFVQDGVKYKCFECSFVSSFKPIIQGSRSTNGSLFVCSYDITQTPMSYNEMINYLINNNHEDLLIEFNNLYNEMLK